MPTTQVKSRLSSIPGQSLVEYLMIGGLVAVVCLGLWMTIAGGLNNILANLKNDMSKNIAAAAPPPVAVSGMSGLDPSAVSKVAKPYTIHLKNGKVIQFSKYPTDIQAAVQTVGANGTTNLLALSLRELAQQLLDSQDLTPAQYNLIQKLATRADKLAIGMKLLENTADEVVANNGSDTVNTWSDSAEFAQKKMDYVKKDQKTKAVGIQLSSGNITDTAGNVITVTELQKFNNMMTKVQNSKVPKEIKLLVMDLAKEVKVLSKQTGMKTRQVVAAAEDILDPSVNIVPTQKELEAAGMGLEALKTQEDADTADTDAKTTCAVGGGTSCTEGAI